MFVAGSSAHDFPHAAVPVPGVGSGEGSPPSPPGVQLVGCQVMSPIVVLFSLFWLMVIIASKPWQSIAGISNAFLLFPGTVMLPTVSPFAVTVTVADPLLEVNALNLRAAMPPGIVTDIDPFLPMVAYLVLVTVIPALISEFLSVLA